MPIKYCPECGGEYQEWAEKCLDCDAVLTYTKPGRKVKANSEPTVVIKGERSYVREPLVAVGAFTNALEAQFNRGILESEGIPSMISSNDSIIAYQPDATSVGNIRLIVKESDAERAKEILDSIEKDISEDMPEATLNDSALNEGEFPEEEDNG